MAPWKSPSPSRAWEPARSPSPSPPPAGTATTTLRNTAIWTGSLDLTAIGTGSDSPWAATLITPDSVAVANHVSTGVGRFYFTDSSNNRYGPYTLNATGNIANTDIMIATHSGGAGAPIPVPSSITPIKIFDPNFRRFLPQPQWGYPLIFGNQDRVIRTSDTLSYQFLQPSFLPEVSATQAHNATRSAWFYAVRGGDSSRPIMVQLGTELALLSLFHTDIASGGTGPIWPDFIPQINSLLATLGSAYTVSTVDIATAGYTDFSTKTEVGFLGSPKSYLGGGLVPADSAVFNQAPS